MRTFKWPRGDMFTLLFDFSPASDDGNPFEDFFTVPVHQKPQSSNDMARGILVKKLLVTTV